MCEKEYDLPVKTKVLGITGSESLFVGGVGFCNFCRRWLPNELKTKVILALGHDRGVRTGVIRTRGFYRGKEIGHNP